MASGWKGTVLPLSKKRSNIACWREKKREVIEREREICN